MRSGSVRGRSGAVARLPVERRRRVAWGGKPTNLNRPGGLVDPCGCPFWGGVKRAGADRFGWVVGFLLSGGWDLVLVTERVGALGEVPR
ncbi:hypothetical protein GCM10010428_64710 [Actinosynnema pretiosum subsp. pretiosum]